MINVLFFGQLKEQLQCGELALESAPSTLEELRQQLQGRGERWQTLLADKQVLMAVNQTICGPEQSLKSGDEVAFFPPVTGG